MEKELTVNLANLNQAETIKTRIEKQVDFLDVTNAHSERKTFNNATSENLLFALSDDKIKL